MSVYVLLKLNTVCRFCLQIKDKLTPIFTDEEYPLSSKASDITSIKIEDDEYLPRLTCEPCHDKICAFYEFKQMVIQSQITLQKKTAIIVKSSDEDTKHERLTEIGETHVTQTNKIHCCPSNISDEPETVENELQSLDSTTTLDPNNEEDAESDVKHHTKYPSMITAIKNNLCLLCLQQCSDRLSLQKHVDAHIAGTSLDPYYLVNDKHIVCQACDKKFKYRFNFLEHQRQHLNIKPFVCEHIDCNHSFYSNSTLKQHLSLHASKNYICATCGHGFKRKSDLRCHEIIHKDDGKLYTCNACFKQFKNRITLKAHTKTHSLHPKHQCPHCAKEYYSRSELCRHMFRHAEKKMFTCNVCDRAYFSKSALNRHSREMCNQGNITNVTNVQPET